MKLVLIYRKQRSDAFSIEELFKTIACALQKQVEVLEYEVGGRWNILRDIIKLRALKADVYHITGDVNYFIPFLPRGRTVLTVHDIGHLLYGLSGIKRKLYKLLWLTWPIRSATAVTCVSKETARNLSTHLKVPAGLPVVIQNCYSPLFQPVAKPFNSETPTILQVGTKSYKNVPRLVRALRGIRCRLVLVGKIDVELSKTLAEAGTEYINHVNLSHEALVREYVACDIVSFASIGEGFGVPIIEAQAIGRPLLTSDVSPLREVAGAGACLVDPLREASIRAGICRLSGDAAYRGELVEKGFANVQRFSARSVAERYLAVYRRVISASGARGRNFEAGSAR